MDQNVRLSEKLAIIATIDPAANVASYSDYIDMADWEQVMAIAMTGDMSAHAIDFACYGYTDESASNETEIMSTTQLAAHAANNDNEQLVISVRNEDVQAKATTHALRYIRFKITSTDQTGYSACVVLGSGYRFGNPVDADLASVTEIEDDRT